MEGRRINKDELRSLIFDIVKVYMDPDNGKLTIEYSSLKDLLYSLVTYELRKLKLYYAGLNLKIIHKFRKEALNELCGEEEFTDPNKIAEEELDMLAAKLASGEKVNMKRVHSLKRKLSNG